MKDLNKIVEENINLVHHVIRKHFPYFIGSPHYDDAVQEGLIGLMNGIKNFDESLGYQFSTYAYKAIQGNIFKNTKDYFTPVKVPRGAFGIYRKYKELEGDLTMEEIALDIGIRVSTLEGIINAYYAPSLDKEFYDDEGKSMSFADTLMFEDEDDFSEDIRLCNILLNLAPAKEYEIFKLHLKGLSQVEIGKKLGISQAQVSREMKSIKKNTFSTIKKYLDGDFGYGGLLIRLYRFNAEVKTYMSAYINLAIEMGHRGHGVLDFLQDFDFQEILDFLYEGVKIPSDLSRLLRGIDNKLYINDIEILIEEMVGVYEKGWIEVYAENQ